MEETEKWKSLDFLGYVDYEVSNYGRVKSLNYKRSGKEGIMKLKKDDYLRVQLFNNGKDKFFPVHKLVALAFLPNQKNLPIINHKDENKYNNKVENLEWCDYHYNYYYGTSSERARKNISLSLKGKGAKPILQYTLEGEFVREWDSIKQASEELNLNASVICNYLKGRFKSAYGYVWKYK